MTKRAFDEGQIAAVGFCGKPVKIADGGHGLNQEGIGGRGGSFA